MPHPTTIDTVQARRVWDSRGRPTIEAELRLASGAIGRAIAPAGASKGRAEAVDRRDGGPAFAGHGVGQALAGLRERIAPALQGMDAADQGAIDAALIALDGTPNRASLGANAMIAVSMAASHAAAAAAACPSGGISWATVPAPSPSPCRRSRSSAAGRTRRDGSTSRTSWWSAPAPATVDEALAWTAEIFRAAGLIMAETGRLAGVADEGGWWPAFDGNEEALETLVRAIERAGRRPGDEVMVSLDVAASEVGTEGRYRLARDGAALDRDGLFDLLAGWIERYPIVSIEDPFGEDDPEGFLRFTRAFGQKVQIVGDDFLVTDAARVRAAAQSGTANAVLIKPNQRGTLTETLAAWEAARAYGMGGIVSARSGETEDVTICHLAIGWQVPQLKVGSFSRSERMAKWNELIRIEEALGTRACFAGHTPYASPPPTPSSGSMSV
jgi:enolase